MCSISGPDWLGKAIVSLSTLRPFRVTVAAGVHDALDSCSSLGWAVAADTIVNDLATLRKRKADAGWVGKGIAR